ncbi:hypothetical protein [Streptomyces sp. NRRL S-646]|uniref:hypothetical protein n=1 Tax=Streptomyces sp. NRRL S-646 TaxID=1463917 RepID=UPI0013315CDA|nr:hypothetical protein [Streptomyces sp. NRRL S-646]
MSAFTGEAGGISGGIHLDWDADGMLAGRALEFLRDLSLHILDGPLVDLEPGHARPPAVGDIKKPHEHH